MREDEDAYLLRWRRERMQQEEEQQPLAPPGQVVTPLVPSAHIAPVVAVVGMTAHPS